MGGCVWKICFIFLYLLIWKIAFIFFFVLYFRIKYFFIEKNYLYLVVSGQMVCCCIPLVGLPQNAVLSMQHCPYLSHGTWLFFLLLRCFVFYVSASRGHPRREYFLLFFWGGKTATIYILKHWRCFIICCSFSKGPERAQRSEWVSQRTER